MICLTRRQILTSVKSLREIDPVTWWAEEVEKGSIVAGPHVRNSAKRHLLDIENGPDRGLIWDANAGLEKINWIQKYLRLNGGRFEGKPFLLHASQVFRVGSLFGWKRDDGVRRFTRFYDEEGKGNGKSPMLAAIGMIGLMADGRARAEIYAAASKKDQALILFRDAVAMQQQSPIIDGKTTVNGENPPKEIVYVSRKMGRCVFKPISSDDGQSGPRPHMGLCDEIHEHKNGLVVEMLERGAAKYPDNSLIAMATNSGHDRKSFCYSQHMHAIKVAAGDVIDDSTFSFVANLDHSDDWMVDPTCWAKANPLLDVTIRSEDLAKAVKQATQIPAMANNIARLHFCVWTESHTVWMARDTLKKCIDETLTENQFTNCEYYEGLDLSMTRDMTGRAKVYRDGFAENGKPCFALFAHGYLPADGLEDRSRIDDAPYGEWTKEGFITATNGSKVDYGYVVSDIVDSAQNNNLKTLCYDQYLSRFFFEELERHGAEEIPTCQHPQGWNRRRDTNLYMPDSIALFEELILEGRIRIENNPALIAAIMSVTFDESATGLRKFAKNKATARIDLAVAATMAVGAALTNLEEQADLSGFLNSPVYVNGV